MDRETTQGICYKEKKNPFADAHRAAFEHAREAAELLSSGGGEERAQNEQIAARHLAAAIAMLPPADSRYRG